MCHFQTSSFYKNHFCLQPNVLFIFQAVPTARITLVNCFLGITFWFWFGISITVYPNEVIHYDLYFGNTQKQKTGLKLDESTCLRKSLNFCLGFP